MIRQFSFKFGKNNYIGALFLYNWFHENPDDDKNHVENRHLKKGAITITVTVNAWICITNFAEETRNNVNFTNKRFVLITSTPLHIDDIN